MCIRDRPHVVLPFWEPFILLHAYQKILAFAFLTRPRPFLSAHVMELWPKVVRIAGWRCHPGWLNSGISFRDVFHTSAFCSQGGSMSSRGVTIYAFWLWIDVKVSESYGSICFSGTSATAHCGYGKIFTEGWKLLMAGWHAIVMADGGMRVVSGGRTYHFESSW